MRHTIIALLITAFAVFSTSAFATPTSYYDDAWANFIEKNGGKTTPDGYPFGKGAISNMREEDTWPEPFLKLVAPTDMSKAEAIQLSQKALSDDRFYASESMAAFLSASSETLRTLTKQKDIKIPVYLLAYKAELIPVPTVNDLQEVRLGIYLTNGNAPIVDADNTTDGGVVFSPNTNYLSGESYQLYAKNIQSQYASILEMKSSQVKQTLYEAYNEVGPKQTRHNRPTHSPQQSIKSAKSFNTRTNRKEILEKYRNQINELQTQIRESEDADERVKLTKQIHQLEDEKEKELNADLSPKAAERMAQRQAISKPYDEKIRALELELAALEHGRDSLDERKEIQEQISALIKERREALQDIPHQPSTTDNNDRQTSAQHKAQQHASRPRINAVEDELDDDAWLEAQGEDEKNDESSLDLATTWLMFEAMLTQKTATVTQIKLPGSLRTRLLLEAKNAKRSPKVIEKFQTLAITTKDSAISVQIACSIRDRFLGCSIKGDDATEAKINKIAQAIVNNAKSASQSDQLHAMQLIVNAKPQKIKNTINLDSHSRPKDPPESMSYFDNGNVVMHLSAPPNFELVKAYKRVCGINDAPKSAKGKKGSKKHHPIKVNDQRLSNGSKSLVLPF